MADRDTDKGHISTSRAVTARGQRSPHPVARAGHNNRDALVTRAGARSGRHRDVLVTRAGARSGSDRDIHVAFPEECPAGRTVGATSIYALIQLVGETMSDRRARVNAR